MYNNWKNFIYSQNIFEHVSVADTAIVREVHLCEPKHRCCKLSVLCTHKFTLRPHQHRACWDAPGVDVDTNLICVCTIRQTGNLQQRCLGSQRWTSVTMVVAATETWWNIFWLYTKFFELLCMLAVSIWKVLRPATSTQVFLGFPLSTSECWDGSQVSQLPLHASNVALQT